MRIDAYYTERGYWLKYSVLVKILTGNGYELFRHGHDHDIFRKDKKNIPVPRHKEISEILAKRILKQAGIK